ncbi:bifunctional 3-(3-hydroxy-phenyl)propionate/3-hydroxycinnamic acid hydroxylase [Bordetella hinzii]|uniref:bifunctional 3-(3-hydroxy-phenyl)propionate/3-hydroxycinnamic acid hydroxylase n=1 Tax=Bordetella hinzii TaxID=103855 RepID=UPI003F1DFF40
MQDVDVAIVGCGPTGATLGNLLAGRGHRIALLDRATEIYPKPRAITADHEALRAFQECGLAEEISAGAIAHPGTDYLGVRGQVIKRFYPLDSLPPLAWEPTFMFAQPELEAVLRRGLQHHGNARMMLGRELLAYEQDDTGVSLRLDGGELLRARYLLACDGGRSLVRKQAGVGVEDLAFDENWIIIDAHLRGHTALPERCVQYCRPSRPGTYIVGPGLLRRWEIKMLPGERPQDFETEAALRRVLREFVDDSGLDIIRTAVYRFHALVAQRWRDGRVFLLGDAAHQMPPFMGQGLCAGVRDAVNLAWKLDHVMRGAAGDALLDSYEAERKPHAKTVVAHAKAFGLIIGELDADRARQRDARLEAELASGKAQTVRQHFIPDLAGGLIAMEAPGRPAQGAGELFVQPWVFSGGSWSRLDDVMGFGFLLALREPALLQALPRSLVEAWQALGGRHVVIGPAALPERDGLFETWMKRHEAQAAIVRPDRYVYGTATDAAALETLLSRLLRSLAAQPCSLDGE